MSPIRVTIADDSQPMRMVYQRVLETQIEFEVVGMAADGEEALEQAITLTPDVAILDIVMLKKNGIEVAQRILNKYPETGIVVICSYADPAYVSAIMETGAKRRAYILKNSLSEISELIRIVQAVGNGQTILDSAIVSRLLGQHRQRSSSPLGPLTATEENILQLILEAQDTSFIARTLELQPADIEASADYAFAKLGVIERNSEHRASVAVQKLVRQSI